MNPYGMDMMMDPASRQRQALLSQMRSYPGGSSGFDESAGAVKVPSASAPKSGPYEPPEGPSFQPAPGVTNPGGQVMPPTAGPKTYGQVSGFENSKMNDLNYHSPKYDLGRAISDIGAAEFKAGTGQAKLLAALKDNPFFKNARVDGDKLYYTGQQGQPVTIDFVKGINSDHPELNYLTSDHGGAPAAGGFNADDIRTLLGGGQQTTNPVAPSVAPTDQNSQLWQQLMARLGSLGDQNALRSTSGAV